MPRRGEGALSQLARRGRALAVGLRRRASSPADRLRAALRRAGGTDDPQPAPRRGGEGTPAHPRALSEAVVARSPRKRADSPGRRALAAAAGLLRRSPQGRSGSPGGGRAAAGRPARGAAGGLVARVPGWRAAPAGGGGGGGLGGWLSDLRDGAVERWAQARVDPALAASAGAHVLLIVAALVGGVLAQDRTPAMPEEMSVQIVSSSELAAMEAALPAPPPAAVEQPAPPLDTAEPSPPQARPEPPAAPEPAAAPEPEAPEPPPVPEAPEPEPAPQPEAPPPAPAPSAPPLPAERVAPVPAPAPPPEAEVAEAERAQTAPSPDAPAAEEEPPAAPEEAGNVLATEALPEREPEETPPLDAPPLEASPSLAPEATRRPPPRPAPPEPETAVAEAPRTPPAVAEADSASVEAPPEPEETRDDAIFDALAESLEEAPEEAAPEPAPEASAAASPPALASASPLTPAQEEGLRLAIKSCWNVGTLSMEALRTVVRVYVEFDPTGRPIIESIRMADFEGGSRDAAERVFNSARNAVIRCGNDGYPLPPERYEAWRRYHLKFNGEGMLSR